MNRWIALLLSIVGGAVAAYCAVLVFVGAAVGILWLYVFGDDPWPEGWETVLEVIIVGGGLFLWFYVARLIWLRLRPAG